MFAWGILAAVLLQPSNSSNSTGNIIADAIMTASDVLYYAGASMSAVVVSLTGLRLILSAARGGDNSLVRAQLLVVLLGLMLALALMMFAPSIANGLAQAVRDLLGAGNLPTIPGITDILRLINSFTTPIAKAIVSFSITKTGYEYIRNLAYNADDITGEIATAVINQMLGHAVLLFVIQSAPSLISIFLGSLVRPS